MAKKSLSETVDEKDIVDLNEEVNEPNILIDDEYGIKAGILDYALVKRTIAHRKGTEDDGENNGKVIRYTNWINVNYGDTIVRVFKNYFELKELEKIKNLTKANIKEVALIHKDIRNTLDKAIENLGLSQQEKYSLNLIDEINEMKNKIKDINKILKEADDLYSLIKEKRKIIVDNTKNIK